MSTRSTIEWTQSTWNPLTGCTKVSPGCKNCYAERMARRLQAMGNANYRDGFSLALHPHVLERPLRWKKPQMIFVNSMSDLFHQDVPESFIQQAFAIMRLAHWHTFQVLTKRSERLLELDSSIAWPENVWIGVSVENQDYAFRVDHLRQTHARVKFLSLEPLLGPLTLDLNGIRWVIVGASPAPKPGPWQRIGCRIFAGNARPSTCPSSSSSGAACAKNVMAGCWMAAPGMRCRLRLMSELILYGAFQVSVVQ